MFLFNLVKNICAKYNQLVIFAPLKYKGNGRKECTQDDLQIGRIQRVFKGLSEKVKAKFDYTLQIVQTEYGGFNKVRETS